MNWLYDEFQQTGKDYASQEEVDIYDPSHDDFRDIGQELDEAVNWIQPTLQSRILDIGCGTGNFSIHFSERCQRLYALDISPPMLALAQKKAAEKKRDNIEFIHAGYLTFDLPERSIHGVISSLSLHHLPDFWKAVALKRLFAVLAPGGKLYFHDVVIPDDHSEKAIQEFIDLQGERGGDFLREDTQIHFKEEYSTCDWVMQGLLRTAGFRIRQEKTRDRVLKTYYCEKPHE
ncbi:class I SAM-dependent methyltransferase [Cyclobacterium xiamenense]|uniref:class I SAM-dependent methyltransferase n=1 Tax=Cyclobacterium xiamenense TaxID=1297121 RepID=UPI0012B9C774|nr:class I SAM-dependent methyltransferase [Cyclobacterium xiamenense]